jgi:hypothetical protein
VLEAAQRYLDRDAKDQGEPVDWSAE